MTSDDAAVVGPVPLWMDRRDAGRDCVLSGDALDGTMVMPFIQPLARSGWHAGSASSSAGPAFLEGYVMTCAGCDEVAAFPCRECPRWDCEERQRARPIAGMYGLVGRGLGRLVGFYAGCVAAGVALGYVGSCAMRWWFRL